MEDSYKCVNKTLSKSTLERDLFNGKKHRNIFLIEGNILTSITLHMYRCYVLLLIKFSGSLTFYGLTV